MGAVFTAQANGGIDSLEGGRVTCYFAGMATVLDGTPAGFIDAADVDTIELELSAEQLLLLTHAAAVHRPEPEPASVRAAVPAPVRAATTAPDRAAAPAPVPAAEELLPHLLPPTLVKTPEANPPATGRRGVWVAVALGIAAAAAVLVVGLTYLVKTPAPPPPVAAAVVPSVAAPEPHPAPPDAEEPPVQFKNPFDRREVFEFPPGTTHAAARDAVADILLQRARDRLSLSPTMSREPKKPAEQVTPVVREMEDRSLQAVLTPPPTGRH